MHLLIDNLHLAFLPTITFYIALVSEIHLSKDIYIYTLLH
jgi:hypothetical protein